MHRQSDPILMEVKVFRRVLIAFSMKLHLWFFRRGAVDFRRSVTFRKHEM